MVVHTPNKIKDTPARVASLGCQIKISDGASVDRRPRGEKLDERASQGLHARACDGPPEQEIRAQSERRWRCHVFFWAGAQCIIVIKYSEKTTHTENQNHTPNRHKGKV